MHNASSILHGHVWDRAGLRPEASQEAAPTPGVLFALPANVGTVMTMSGLCVLEREREEHFYFSSNSKFGNGVNTKFPVLPKGQSNRKNSFSKAPSTLLSL